MSLSEFAAQSFKFNDYPFPSQRCERLFAGHRSASSTFGCVVPDAFAGTVITTNLPANTAIINIDSLADGAAGFNGDQSLWYHPFSDGGPLLTYTIAAGDVWVSYRESLRCNGALSVSDVRTGCSGFHFVDVQYTLDHRLSGIQQRGCNELFNPAVVRRRVLEYEWG